MPSEEDLATADAVSGQLVRLVRLLDRAHAQYQAECPDAVERATYHLLVHLVKDGAHRSSALAGAVHSDPSTVSRQVAHLVRLGLVERAADPNDGRATLLVATGEGRRVFEENRRLRIEKVAAMLAGWSQGDQDTFAQLLGRFATDFETYRTPDKNRWADEPATAHGGERRLADARPGAEAR